MNGSAHDLRKRFARHLLGGLKVVWPIIVGLLTLMATMGLLVAVLEDWRVLEGIYFAFVSGLTIGYGDLAPTLPLARMLAISIGFLGILMTGLVAAIGVQALQATLQVRDDPD